MSFEIECYEVVWNEASPCPQCGCRVLKESYCTRSKRVPYKDSFRLDYHDEIVITQCPYCNYDVTEVLEDDTEEPA